jgi:hypothetical protein
MAGSPGPVSRRKLVHSAVSRVYVPLKKDESAWHHHGCTECGKFYTDAHGCFTGGENDLCQECRGGERPLWDHHADPVECCLTFSRLVTDQKTLLLYKLGGSAPWYQCQKCKRAQVYQPRILEEK